MQATCTRIAQESMSDLQVYCTSRLIPVSCKAIVHVGLANLKPCPHCGIRRQSPFSATIWLFCDSLTFVRQCHFSTTVCNKKFRWQILQYWSL